MSVYRKFVRRSRRLKKTPFAQTGRIVTFYPCNGIQSDGANRFTDYAGKDMNGMLQDLRYSIRRLISAPGFTLTVVGILALGIGVNSALLTALDHMMIRPLPYSKPGQLVVLWEDYSAVSRSAKNRVSPATFLDWRKRTRSFEQVEAYGLSTMNLTQDGPPEQVLGVRASPHLLPMLGVPPLIGRTFTDVEDRTGAKSVVLSYSLWRRRFHNDPRIVEEPIVMSGEKYDVIGVMPAGFQFPDRQGEFWIPLSLPPQLAARRNSHFLNVVGRLKDGQTLKQAQQDMNEIAGQLSREYPATNEKIGINAVPLKQEMLADTGTTLALLLGASGCVLLIACANIGNLLLARSTARRKEVAVKTALGASPARMLRQMLLENAALAIAGGAAGLTLAKAMTSAMELLVPTRFVGIVDLSPDWRTVGATVAISTCASLLFGFAPALKLLRTSVANPLEEAGRANLGYSGSRLRDTLVVAEIGIALVLLIGATLLVRTLTRLHQYDAGFRAGNILTAHIDAPLPKYHEASKREALYDRILDNVRAIPGVRSAGLTSDLPFTSTGNTMSLTIDDRQGPPNLAMDVLFRLVSSDYLQTIGARLVAGRLLESSDGMDTPAVVVINETLAHLYWPNDSALGKRIDTGTGDGNPKWMTIVGIVADIRERGLDLESKGAVYVPYPQTTISFFQPDEIAVLTSQDPLSISKELDQAVHSVDPEQPISNLATMESLVDARFSNRSNVLMLLGAFAVLAIVLAAFGIYGVLTYVVSLRAREIGLRMAVGATRFDVIREFLWYFCKRIAAGLMLGLALAFATTRLLSAFMFGVSTLDGPTFTAASAGLALIALAAAWFPLLRASRVDPMDSLRTR
jgi:putative ABC transport system permease protein